MPNHVQNILTLKGKDEDIKAFLNALKGKDEETGEDIAIDFNNIIPMPKTLKDVVSGSITDSAIAVYLYKIENDSSKLKEMYNSRYGQKFETLNDFCEELIARGATIELGKTYVDNERLYGASTWYDWSIKNWGTKWNAYCVESIDNGVTWHTAWSGVTMLMMEISKKYPEIELYYKFADEDIGYNVAEMIIKNGDIIEIRDIEFGSEEAINLANEIWGF